MRLCANTRSQNNLCSTLKMTRYSVAARRCYYSPRRSGEKGLAPGVSSADVFTVVCESGEGKSSVQTGVDNAGRGIYDLPGRVKKNSHTSRKIRPSVDGRAAARFKFVKRRRPIESITLRVRPDARKFFFNRRCSYIMTKLFLRSCEGYGADVFAALLCCGGGF
jgi:hypothetical protein